MNEGVPSFLYRSDTADPSRLWRASGQFSLSLSEWELTRLTLRLSSALSFLQEP